MKKTQHPETIVLHSGWRADPATGAVAVPIFQTTAFQFESVEHAADLFALKKPGNIYTRIMNPTTAVLEERLAALEGGVAAVAFASGQAASTAAVLNLAASGDNIVCSTDVYGGTWNLFANTLGDLGVEARFVDPFDPEAFGRVSDDRTRAYYAETLPNPKLVVFPIGEVAAIGRARGIPLIMDNTSSPLLCRPFEHGAAVVVHSTTKWISGHGTVLGGIVIDGGNFSWERHSRQQPKMNMPDPSYHGAIWTEAAKALGPVAYALKLRVTLLRDLGAALSPANAFQTLQGLETLPLRMERHVQNTSAVAAFLGKRPEVARVIHPSFQQGIARERADRYLSGHFGGIVGFELAEGLEAGKRFINALKLFYHVSNLGDTRSLALHPATTIHSQLTPEERKASGATDGYVRLSIGLEHIDDILADLSQALDSAGTISTAT